MVKLHVNIDHVATIREARKTFEPSPLTAAALAELAGADGITAHLREDRRHIQDEDIRLLRASVKTTFNLEMALSPAILKIALEIRPDEVCIVPEKRQEVTTEGGLDAVAEKKKIGDFVPVCKERGILVSLFLDPEPAQIRAAAEAGADFVEIHTGTYANARAAAQSKELERIAHAVALGKSLGLRMNAGHGLNYQNVGAIARIPGIEELNIGHSIVSRAVFVGIGEAVREMKRAMS